MRSGRFPRSTHTIGVLVSPGRGSRTGAGNVSHVHKATVETSKEDCWGLTWIHRPQMTLGQHPSLLSAGYGFSVRGENLGTSERAVAQVQQASDAWPGRIADRGIFICSGQGEGCQRRKFDFNINKYKKHKLN